MVSELADSVHRMMASAVPSPITFRMSRAPQRHDGTDRLAHRLHLIVMRFELALADNGSLMNVLPSALCTQLVTLGGRSRPALAANTVQGYGEHRTGQAEKSPENTTGNAESQHVGPSESVAMRPAGQLVNAPPFVTNDEVTTLQPSKQRADCATHEGISRWPEKSPRA